MSTVNTLTTERQETVKQIIADTLHELVPTTSLEDWLTHVNENIHDPVKFFAGNGEGLNEYNAFVRANDRDTYERNQKRKKQQQQLRSR